ncbi:MAG: hypothetical protein ACYC5O_13450 [Anaerolineae bacterium]
MMSWRSLRPGVYRGTVQPTVSIQKSGAVTWNQSAHETMGQPDMVEILFDQDRGLLGLRPTRRSEGSFRVRRLGPQNTWITSARGALRRVGLLPENAFRQVAQQDETVLAIDVTELLERTRQPGQDGRASPRTRRAARVEKENQP